MQRTACIALVSLLAVFLAACQTSHEVKTVHEVKPMHITIDVNIRVDRALDDFFSDIDESAREIK